MFTPEQKLEKTNRENEKLGKSLDREYLMRKYKKGLQFQNDNIVPNSNANKEEMTQQIEIFESGLKRLETKLNSIDPTPPLVAPENEINHKSDNYMRIISQDNMSISSQS
jgi:hypothetical protein